MMVMDVGNHDSTWAWQVGGEAADAHWFGAMRDYLVANSCAGDMINGGFEKMQGVDSEVLGRLRFCRDSSREGVR